jgi:hypothetical protein
MKRLLLILCTLPLASCFDDPRTASDQCNAEHFRQLDASDIGQLSGSQSRMDRAMRPTADDVNTGTVRAQ